MSKLRYLLLLLVACLSIVTSAQSEPARLRVMQLSFIPAVSATVNIEIDNNIAFENVRFPFTTTYLEVEPGEHTLTTSIVDVEDASASTTLMLEAGHDYVVIVEGDYIEETVQFVVIDETDAPHEETGSVALIVNLTPEPIIYSINGEVLIENIPSGDYRFAALPQEYLDVSAAYVDKPDDPIYEWGIDPVLDLNLLNVLRVSSSGAVQGTLQRSSPATIAEYLLTFDEAALFGDALVTQLAEAAATGTYTLFVPTTDAIEGMGEIPADAADLTAFITAHIALSDLPAYELPLTESLTMLDGRIASIDTGETESGWWEIDGAPIWWDAHFADGIVYLIDGLLAP